MRKIFLILPLCFSLLVAGCSSNSNDDDESIEENIQLKNVGYTLCWNPTYSEASKYVRLHAVNSQDVQIDQVLYLSCCTEEMSVELTKFEKNTITVSIEDVGNDYGCTCATQLSYRLGNLVSGKQYKLIVNHNSQEHFSTTFTFSRDFESTYSDGSDSGAEVAIVKELPKLRRTIGSNSRPVVIQSQEELEAVFTAEELAQISDLQQIDFSIYTLLLGFGTYANQAYSMEHFFTKTGDNTYTYLLKVGGDATQPDVFRYGIIVDKLPASATVVFKIGIITF